MQAAAFQEDLFRPREAEVDDLRAVAMAFRRVRQSGGPEHRAFLAALDTYRRRHPQSSSGESSQATISLVSAAKERAPAWLRGR